MFFFYEKSFESSFLFGKRLKNPSFCGYPIPSPSVYRMPFGMSSPFGRPMKDLLFIEVSGNVFLFSRKLLKSTILS